MAPNLTPDPETKELTLTSLHPGVAVEKVIEATGWALKVAPQLATTQPPSETELRASVTDAYGRVHGLDNVYVADGSVFVTSGAHNPTNTIMAVALRNMRHLAGG